MKYIVEHFNSIEHLIKSNETRKPNEVFKTKKSSEDGSEGFTGTASYAEAVELIRGGYSDPLEKIKRGVAASSKELAHQKTAVKNDVVGYAPCVPNAIMGIPQSMINKETIAKKSKIVTIVFDATGCCGTATETFIKSGIAVLTIVNALEASGYRVALKTVFYNSSTGNESVFATINLKDWRQPLDLKKMAFPFCHPSMLRRIGFRWLETQPELTETAFRGGYGRSNVDTNSYTEMRNKLIDNKLITESGKYINVPLCKDNDFDPKAVAEACGLDIN